MLISAVVRALLHVHERACARSAHDTSGHTLRCNMSGGFEDLGLLPELVRATQDQGWL
jgi:hypothetical protein